MQQKSSQKRVGFYYWAGPGTIRMTRLKYPGARVNVSNLLESYDYPVLKRAKDTFGLTDVWVTYSWGFSERTEQPDYAFIKTKLANFERLNLRTHAYVQGCNLVVAEHAETDYYCRDFRNRLIPYHRGRKVTCPNNPLFREYLTRKIEKLLRLPFSGVYLDNIHMGQLPIAVSRNWLTFFGCACTYCQQRFHKEYGSVIPPYFNRETKVFTDYVQFRARVMMEFVTSIATLVHSAGKEFGTNSFDPKYDSQITYGTNLHFLEQLQDYLLFENHSLPDFSQKRNNTYLLPLLQARKKPVFIVSYNKGIGREPHYSQTDFDAIYTESKQLNYAPCYKASEFTTKKIWHNLFIEEFRKPTYVTDIRFLPYTIKSKNLRGRKLLKLYNKLYNPLLTALYEKRWARQFAAPLYYYALH